MPRGRDVGDDFDDPNDRDYVSEQDEETQDVDPSVAETTPSSRLEREHALNEESKGRVRTNDPNEGRCLIENCPESRAVDFCHCIPRRFTYKNATLMSNIEWHWNMKYFSLNLDSSHNIFRAGVSMHRLFDNNHYLLYPEQKIIDQYFNALKPVGTRYLATRETFPVIPNRTDFKYKFLPLSDEMEKIAVHRQHNIPSPDMSLATTDFTTHVYPFPNMPLFQSHLHPKFVILETGRKLLDPADQIRALDRYPVLRKLLYIYSAWTRAPPREAKNDETYGRPGGGGDDGGDGGDGDDADTDGGRRLRNGKKRPFPKGGGDSPTPAPKHGKYSSLEAGQSGTTKKYTHGEPGSRQKKNSICLSEKTLIDHERTFGNGKKWSSDAVEIWFKDVLEQAPPPQMSVD